jgi:ferritin-like metal-binding protein YciE
MADLNARDAKLVQFLNEAHAKEAELEADLTAHINLTQKAPYKKRLQQHLRETKDHKRRVAQRIKQLGGTPSAGVRAPGVPDAVGELAGKGLAAVKGQVAIARAAITEQAETHLRNAREELREEYVEIGTYLAIETLATEVGDRETAQLAKSIRRDEQKMADYIERSIPQLVKDVVRAEIPRSERATTGGRSRRRSTSSSRRSTTARKQTTTARKRTTTARKRSTTARKRTTTARKRSTTARKRTTTTARKRTTARSRTTASRNGASASRNGSSPTRRSSSRKRATAGSRS